MKKLLFCWMRKDAGKDADAGNVDATWCISSSSLRMCARQDCFVFECPQVVFYCNFSSSRHVSKSTNLIGRIVFDVARQTQKNEPEAFKKKWRFYACRFSRRCAHSHWRPLFSHEALNVGEYRVRNSSRCVRAFTLKALCLALCSMLGHTHTHTHTHIQIDRLTIYPWHRDVSVSVKASPSLLYIYIYILMQICIGVALFLTHD